MSVPIGNFVPKSPKMSFFREDSRFNFFLLKTEHTKYLQSITIKTTIKTTSTIGINLTNLVELSFEKGLHM